MKNNYIKICKNYKLILRVWFVFLIIIPLILTSQLKDFKIENLIKVLLEIILSISMANIILNVNNNKILKILKTLKDAKTYLVIIEQLWKKHSNKIFQINKILAFIILQEYDLAEREMGNFIKVNNIDFINIKCLECILYISKSDYKKAEMLKKELIEYRTKRVKTSKYKTEILDRIELYKKIINNNSRNEREEFLYDMCFMKEKVGLGMAFVICILLVGSICLFPIYYNKPQEAYKKSHILAKNMEGEQLFEKETAEYDVIISKTETKVLYYVFEIKKDGDQKKYNLLWESNDSLEDIKNDYKEFTNKENIESSVRSYLNTMKWYFGKQSGLAFGITKYEEIKYCTINNQPVIEVNDVEINEEKYYIWLIEDVNYESSFSTDIIDFDINA